MAARRSIDRRNDELPGDDITELRVYSQSDGRSRVTAGDGRTDGAHCVPRPRMPIAPQNGTTPAPGLQGTGGVPGGAVVPCASTIHWQFVEAAAAYAICRRTATLLRVAFEYGQT
jgi:hypothetical protein